MIWFRKQKQRPPEEITVPKLNFISEQDGPPEQDFKNALLPILSRRPHVLSAFLARVDYGKPNEFNVSLCIRSELPEDIQLKKEADRFFSSQFGTHEHLDIILIRPEQEVELRRVCFPFYEKLPTSRSTRRDRCAVTASELCVGR